MIFTCFDLWHGSQAFRGFEGFFGMMNAFTTPGILEINLSPIWARRACSRSQDSVPSLAENAISFRVRGFIFAIFDADN